jgi:hypothetical protein
MKALDIRCLSPEPLDIWQFKIRNLRKKLKGWSRNIEAGRKKSKVEIMARMDCLHVQMEKLPLNDDQKKARKDLREELDQIWKIEEIRAR